MPIALTVCDDSVMSRKGVMRAIPSEWDVQITQASNGLEALEAVAQGKAEVLFLDLTMPIMDGLEVLERLHKNQSTTKVIVISADFQPEVSQRVMELGAVAFIHKPVNGDKLREVLSAEGYL